MSRLNEAQEAARRRPIYHRTFAGLESAFRRIEKHVPNPIETTHGRRLVYRYSEQTIEAAIFLKFARVVSLTRGVLLLLDAGHVQEQCILQRSIEETNEDILFLCLAITQQKFTEKHEDFLREFWKENYADPDDPVGSRVPRAFSRRGIRSFINRALGQDNPSLADVTSRSVYEMYSGFLHGAAPHIVELFDERRGHFLLDGISSQERFIDYILDAQNSLYRTLLSAAIVTKAFGLLEELAFIQSVIDQFTKEIGIDWLHPAES